MIALLSSILAVCMAVGVMFLRFKAAKKTGNEKENYIAANFYEYRRNDVLFTRVSINIVRNS